MRKTRVLFIRFSSIGDILLTAPAVAAMRAALHGPFEIHFLTKSPNRPLLTGFSELVDVIHTIDRSTAEVLPALRTIGFDHVIDLHNNLRSRRVKRGLDGIAFTVDKHNLAKWLLVRGWRPKPVPHIVERYVDTFRDAFGATSPTVWPEVFPGAALPAGAPPTDRPWVALALGATHTGKQIPADTFRAVIQALLPHGLQLVLIGGPTESQLGEDLAAIAPTRIANFAGQTDFAGSAALLRASASTITGDTGMMHLSAAVGTPVVAVWGCTRPALGMSAWNAPKGSVDVLPVGRGGTLRPCSKLGDSCRHGDDLCIHHVDAEAIFSAALNQTTPAAPSPPRV